jgi:hypothetical protein
MLVAVLGLGAVASSAASAATPEWKFEGKTIKTPLNVTGLWDESGAFKLSDSAINAELSCEVKSTDEVSAKTVETSNFVWEQCKYIKQGGCESVERYLTEEPVGLPWKSELYEEGGKLRERIKSATGERLGWAFSCRAFVGQDCTATELTAGLSNVTNGVDATFEPLTTKLVCSGTAGDGSGSVEGTELLKDKGLTA